MTKKVYCEDCGKLIEGIDIRENEITWIPILCEDCYDFERR